MERVALSVAERGPILRLEAAEVGSLDPARAADWASLHEVGRTYETPLRYARTTDRESDASTIILNSRRLEPWLLERMPIRDPGGRRWTLDFKKGRRFHPSALFTGSDRLSGRELTACDWVDSIRRHLEPGSGSPWRDYLAKRLSDSSAVECESPTRAVIRLRFADPEFEYFLAHPAASVMPIREMVARGWDIGGRPVGSGAFRLEARSPERLRWRAVSAAARVARIDVMLGGGTGPGRAEIDDPWARMQSGQLDAIELPESMREKLLGRDGNLLPEVRSRGVELVKVARSDLVMILLSPAHSLLGAKRGVRLALGLALGRDEIAHEVFAGRAVGATGALPPGLKGYRIDYRHSYQGHDPDRARDLLMANGFRHGYGLPEFRMGCLSHPVERTLCETLRRLWARVGIQVDWLAMGPAERRRAIEAGTIDLWPVTWVADLPGPASFLEVFTGASGLVEVPALPGADRRLEPLLQKIRNASTEGARQLAVEEALDWVSFEGPAVFLLHRFQYWLVRKGVSGIGLEDFSWHDSDQVSFSSMHSEARPTE
jgi:ABC-type transport system substrate-binding protein